MVAKQDVDVMEVRQWELNAIVIQSIIFAGGVMGGIVAVLSRGRIVPQLPESVAFGIGFFVLSIALLPIESLLVRRRYDRETPVWRAVLWSVAGAIVAGAIFALLR